MNILLLVKRKHSSFRARENNIFELKNESIKEKNTEYTIFLLQLKKFVSQKFEQKAGNRLLSCLGWRGLNARACYQAHKHLRDSRLLEFQLGG
jgi:hypothetical protein